MVTKMGCALNGRHRGCPALPPETSVTTNADRHQDWSVRFGARYAEASLVVSGRGTAVDRAQQAAAPVARGVSCR